MIAPGMAARKGARFLAPLALVATIAAIYFLAHRELRSKHVIVHSRTTHLVPPRNRPTRPTAPKANQFYVVKAGDSFSTISAKTGISIQTLEALNSSVDPNTLQT